jgi:flagellar biosynthesis protein FlhF
VTLPNPASEIRKSKIDNPPMPPDLKPGATYKFTVRSTEEAVRTIREQLGENAKVLSVRQVGGEGLTGLFSKPKLEVVAQIAETPVAASASEPSVHAAPLDSASSHSSGTAPVFAFRSDESAAPTGLAESPTPGVLTTTLPATSRSSSAAKTAAPSGTRLPELLRKSGFSEALVSRLQASPAFTGHEDRPLHQALAEVGRSLRQNAAKRPVRPLPARTAFLGTPGVGRTTALCKWLARDVFTKGRTGRVVKAEFDRPNPAEGLAVFCEALGLSLEYHAPSSDVAASASERSAQPPAQPTLQPEPAGGFLYADLPGISLRNPSENAPLAHFLDREKFTGRVLVLNAAYDHAMLRRGYAAGRDLGATHLVFTHLDEVEHWGKLWDFLLDGELSPLFLATGSSLTGDLEEDAFSAVLRRTLPGA